MRLRMSNIDQTLLMQQLYAQLKKQDEGLNTKSGGPTDGGHMESRVAKLEAIAEAIDKRIGLIETDIRALGKKLDIHFYITWGGLIGLAGLIGKGFHWF